MKERFCDNFDCHRLATVFSLKFRAICLDCYLERFFNAPERAIRMNMDHKTEIEVREKVSLVKMAINGAIPVGYDVAVIIIALAELQRDIAALLIERDLPPPEEWEFDEDAFYDNLVAKEAIQEGGGDENDDEILRKAGYDPDEVGAQMKAAAEAALVGCTCDACLDIIRKEIEDAKSRPESDFLPSRIMV